MNFERQRRLAAALITGAMTMGLTMTAEASGFDRAAWAAGRGDDSGSNPRGAQIGALRASGAVSPGRSREDVRALLGEPENVDGTRELYSLGTGFGASLEYFAIEYDTQGRVQRAALRRG